MPQLERSWMTGPRKARNLRSASMKLEVSTDSINSMWMALVVKQVKTTAQRFVVRNTYSHPPGSD